MKTVFASVGLLFAVVGALGINIVNADTLNSEGVAGDIDGKNRSPHLTVGTTIGTNQVTILADAFHPSGEFSKYPIQFDFFVNRTLFATQYRSPTLGGPVGVTVPSSVAKPPFNYVVVAKTLHPNSVYTTVIEGAVYTNTLGATVDCTVTLPGNEETDDTIYTASDVSLGQTGNSNVDATFSAKSQDGTSTIQVTTQLSVSTESSGTFTVAKDGEEEQNFSGSAEVEKDSASITSFSISADDGGATLTCSK